MFGGISICISVFKDGGFNLRKKPSCCYSVSDVNIWMHLIYYYGLLV
jgi:hypothetical protein